MSKDEQTFTILPPAEINYVTPTLTKREYFAGLAMQGLVYKDWAKPAAEMAVEYADALIEELERE